MSGFDIFTELEKQNTLAVRRFTVRLIGLEDTIILAKPDYCEAAESILAPMMAALEKRYEFEGDRQALADVQEAYGKLFKALMAADQVEAS